MAENKNAIESTEGTKRWLVAQEAITVEESGTSSGKKITLGTAGKFLDRNIEIEAPTVTVADGIIAAEAPTIESGSAKITADGFTASTSETNYAVVLSTTDGSAISKAKVTTAGFVDVTDTDASEKTTVTVTTVGNDTIYIPEADVTPTVVDLSAPSVATATSTTGFEASESATGFSITVSNTADKGSVTAKATVSGIGMVDTGDTSSSDAVEISASNTIDGNAGPKTIYLKETSISNTATSGVEYDDVSDSAPVLTSGDFLYINEGYNTAQKISLAKLVPDDSNLPTTGTESPWMYKTVSAYNNDGTLIAGTMDDAVIVGDSAATEITSVNVVLVDTAPDEGTEGTDYFKLTSSGSGNSKVTAAGYVAAGSLPASNAATKDYYIAAASHTNAATVTDYIAPTGTYAVNTTSSSTDYSIDGITTTQPAEGKTYITIEPTLSSQKGSVKASATCTNSEGYSKAGTATDTSAASEIAFNATKGTTQYIEIFTGDYILG